MPMWSVPKLWPGKRVAILAPGPSMSQEVANSVRARGLPTIALNRSVELAPWADMLVASDSAFWHTYERMLAPFAGLRVGCQAAPAPPPNVNWLKTSGQTGYDPNPEFVRTGANSGYAAIHIAAQAGATEIELHGYDMRGINGRQHFHGNHPNSLRNHGEGIYQSWLPHFDTLHFELQKIGVSVVNCTRGSALRCFPFEEVVTA